MGGHSALGRPFVLFACLVVACAVDDEPGRQENTAGSAGSVSAGGAGNAGTSAGSFVVGGTAGAMAGTSGRAGSTNTAGAGGTRASGGDAGDDGAGGRTAAASGEGGTTDASGGTGAAASGAGGTAGSALGGTAGLNAGQAGAGGSAGADDDHCSVANAGAAPTSLALTGILGTHDPVVIAAHGRYYLFSTGYNVGAKTSEDLLSWQSAPDVWSEDARPAWIADEVPEAVNLWAPDISYFGGKYHLYYSASSFGCNVSCIGHATRDALDAGRWIDHGSVVCSNPGASCQGNRPDNWNAIDPNVVVDREGTPWLAFGSFWGGLKLIELDENGERVGNTVHSIAARPSDGGALEAPFIVRRCGYYYLFASWDSCCQGADSTYNTRVGRAETVTGPYTDKAGTPLMQGGGTLVLAGEGRYRGPGHNAVLFTDTGAYNVYHSYDADRDGSSQLRISELVWDEEGWPVSGGP